MGELRGETQEGEAGVRSVRRTWDEINAYQRVAPTEISLIFSIFKKSPVTDGCHNPISSLVPSPNSSHHQAHQCLMALSSTCLLDPCYLASQAWWVLAHMSLALGIYLRNHCH